MRLLIALALIVALAKAAPPHGEPEIESTEPTIEVLKDHQKKNVETSKIDDAGSKTKSSENHSEHKEVEDDVEEEELDFDDNDGYQGPGGVEMIALFVMKLQPAQQTSLFEYPMVLPVGPFGGPYNYLMHDRSHERNEVTRNYK